MHHRHGGTDGGVETPAVDGCCTAGQMEGWKNPLWMTGHIVADRFNNWAGCDMREALFYKKLDNNRVAMLALPP